MDSGNQTRQRERIQLDMMRSIVTEPLLSKVAQAANDGDPERSFEVIISLNELFRGGMDEAMKQVQLRADQWHVEYTFVSNYLFACLTAKQILDLAQEARNLERQKGRSASVVYRIWEDTEISTTLTRSLTTVKADAAQRAFQARGEGIVWAVLDSGIQGDHPHFKTYETLNVPSPLAHCDFTPEKGTFTALADGSGHGTHVAGIIAGGWQSKNPDGESVIGIVLRNELTDEAVTERAAPLRAISGVAPLAKLVSMKVISDTRRSGKVSWVLQAIDQIQQWNQNGKRLLIQGANLSLGYDFDPRWFACGQSPICVEVNRLVRSGVSVVVSAGNSGYSTSVTAGMQTASHYSELSITDPGNADLAITVGSTHREMPHTYGVSYFSSRGPTGDGRLKPDLLAPGERIISCAAGAERDKFDDPESLLYVEQTGTSMAAPHVSGAIAAFLSVRSEFVGQPERVKQILMANTVDLRREPRFQGAGLLDLMKVLQAV